MTNCIHLSEFWDTTVAVDFQNRIFYWNKQITKRVQLQKQILKIKVKDQIIQRNNFKHNNRRCRVHFYKHFLEKWFIMKVMVNQKQHQMGKQHMLVKSIEYRMQQQKKNIIFGKQFNQQQYENAIYFSCLKQDLQILINGDQTIIGEKGINLSGGQKAKISLAKTIYSESDIILLDDPLSAVDSHVGKFIMKECLLGKLKQTTCILITLALNYCI